MDLKDPGRFTIIWSFVTMFENATKSVSHMVCLRESSFIMTREGDEDIEGGGAPKIFRHQSRKK